MMSFAQRPLFQHRSPHPQRREAILDAMQEGVEPPPRAKSVTPEVKIIEEAAKPQVLGEKIWPDFLLKQSRKVSFIILVPGSIGGGRCVNWIPQGGA
jgi:hypothetical protein